MCKKRHGSPPASLSQSKSNQCQRRTRGTHPVFEGCMHNDQHKTPAASSQPCLCARTCPLDMSLLLSSRSNVDGSWSTMVCWLGFADAAHLMSLVSWEYMGSLWDWQSQLSDPEEEHLCWVCARGASRTVPHASYAVAVFAFPCAWWCSDNTGVCAGHSSWTALLAAPIHQSRTGYGPGA